MRRIDMREEKTIRYVNGVIDNLLGISPGRDFSQATNDAGEMDSLIKVASILADTEFQEETLPAPGLRERWMRGQADVARPDKSNRLLIRFAWATAFVAIMTLLIIFHQPVMAAFGRLLGYGYLPEAGFFRLDGTYVLDSPVEQTHDGNRLTVTQGLAGSQGTRLWITFSTSVDNPEAAWLEMPDQSRVELQGWGRYPDQPASQGLLLIFPALPKGRDQVVLAFEQGWRLPLKWVPAAQAGIPSTNLLVPYPLSGTEESADPGTASPDNQLTASSRQTCVESNALEVCLQAAYAYEGGLELLLEGRTLNGELHPGGYLGDLVGPGIAGDDRLYISGISGQSVDAAGGVPGEISQDGLVTQTLKFPFLLPDTGELTLHIPSFYAHLNLDTSIELDLGPDPQPGQQLALDASLDILGQRLHFSQATLVGDGSRTLRLEMKSDPQETGDGIVVTMLELGKPQGIDDMYGSGFGPQRQVSVTVELLGVVSGLKTGVLDIPVVGATVMLPGPYEIPFQVPQESPQVAQTPVSADPGSFEPAPTPTPLSMADYSFSGRALQPGDLLFTVVEGEQTQLYAANPQDDLSAQLVAVLPGKVYSIGGQSDLTGIYYLTADHDEVHNTLDNGQVFKVSLDGTLPVLLTDSLAEDLSDVQWSHDGHFLALQAVDMLSEGLSTWLVDLACQGADSCQPRRLDLPEPALWNMQWSPVDDVIAFSGVPAGSKYGAADIFVANLDENGNLAELVNLTASEEIYDMFPQWLSDGSGMVFVCSLGGPDPNLYHLCKNDLQVGQEEVVMQIPVETLHQVKLAPDNSSFVGDIYNPQTQTQEYIQVFLQDGAYRSLVELENYSVRVEFSSDSRYLTIIDQSGHDDPQRGWVQDANKLYIIDLSAGENHVLFESQSPQLITWQGWVR
jgi:hypothetical protein